MTRRIVYAVGFHVFLAATAMTIASIVVPEWISWNVDKVTGGRVHYSYGLHSRCSSVTGQCQAFPDYDTCHGPASARFCSLWRTVGFLMSFTCVLEFAGFVAYAVILLGGRATRERGWRVLAALLALAALAQAVAMSAVAYLFDHDDRFAVPGWSLGTSWILCTVAWALLAADAAAMVAAALTLESEGDYELIPERPILDDATSVSSRVRQWRNNISGGSGQQERVMSPERWN